jgi:site-specific DNA-methyltransferase (adenine-specific)
MWLYGSGFPKSHNIGKAVDKLQGNDREVVGEYKVSSDFSKHSGSMMSVDNTDNGSNHSTTLNQTKGTSEWEGWGTAMKPSVEPICVARKPLSEKTVAENVLKWGTGGINIDGCRVGSEIIETNMKNTKGGLYNLGNEDRTNEVQNTFNEGRFPANIILDEIAGELLDEQSGISKSSSNKWEGDNNAAIYGKYEKGIRQSTFSDKGGASRFFYQAKVSKQERNMGLENFEDKVKVQQIVQSEGRKDAGSNESSFLVKNNHPTVKPVSLMAYLCRLVTPPNGIVLDPFMGSGSMAIAANKVGGFDYIGIELNPDYFAIAKERIAHTEHDLINLLGFHLPLLRSAENLHMI